MNPARHGQSRREPDIESRRGPLACVATRSSAVAAQFLKGIRMQSRIGASPDIERRPLQILRRAWPILVVIGACGLAAGQFGPGARPVSISPQCAAWDAEASTVLAALIADPSESAEAQLGDAVFRL